MFVKSIRIARKAMFPIFCFEKLTPQKQLKVGVVGTGFFINSEGYLATVAHIFDRKSQNVTFKYWGILPDKVINPPLEIQEVARDNKNDIFIGKVDAKSPGFFLLCKKIPDVGRSVCVSGYPLAKITKNPQGGAELGGVRRYFQPSFVLDKVKMNSKTNGVIRKHDGFLVRDVGLFGMSGGPVFDPDGIVVGIQASVTSPRESKNAAGRKIVVENACVIRGNLIQSFLRKHKIRTPRSYPQQVK